MNDERKTKKQLIAELEDLRQRVADEDAPLRLAIEKVRAGAMAMRSTADLGDLATTFILELHGLGIDTEFVSIALFQDDRIVHYYQSNKNFKARGLEWRGDHADTFRIRQLNDDLMVVENDPEKVPYFDQKLAAYRHQRVETLENDTRSTDEFAAIIRRRWQGPDRVIAQIAAERKDSYIHQIPFPHGIVAFSDRIRDDGHIEAVARLAAAFSFGYDRYLDFERLETQNRDLIVERALEQVRAHAVAMHKSEELAEVRDILFREFHNLGYPIRSASIAVREAGTDRSTVWLIRPDIGFSAKADYSGLYEDTERRNARAAQAQGATYYAYEWNKAEYDTRLRDFCKKANLDDPEALGFSFRGRKISYRIFFTYGAVTLWTTEPLNGPDLDVAKRFVDTFDFSYTRFLELQLKETQIRLAERERAIERVRAEAMAMRERDDLIKVVAVMRGELMQIGVDLWLCKISFLDSETDSLTEYSAYPNPRLYDIEIPPNRYVESTDETIVAVEDNPNLSKRTDDYLERQHQGDAWSFTSDELAAQLGGDPYSAAIAKQLGADTGDLDWLQTVFEREGRLRPDSTLVNHSITIVPFTHGSVTIHMRDLTPVDVDIVEAFTEAISLGYLRFLDFRQLEVQNRDLQVEQALERVRTEIAAMQKGQDLFAVIDTILASVRDLDIHCLFMGFNIIDEAAGTMNWYHSWQPGENAPFMGRNFDLKRLEKVPIFDEVIDHWRRGAIWHRCDSAALISRCVKVGAEIGVWLEEELVQHNSKFLGTVPPDSDFRICDVPFIHGTMAMLRLDADGPYTDDEIRLFERFTEVFALGYRRYLDLEAAERQVEEARREQAVERVRAEAMAMRESDDLTQVVAVIFRELRTFAPGVEFCLINLIDEEYQLVRGYEACADLPQEIRGQHNGPIVDMDEGLCVALRTTSQQNVTNWLDRVSAEQHHSAVHDQRAEDSENKTMYLRANMAIFYHYFLHAHTGTEVFFQYGSIRVHDRDGTLDLTPIIKDMTNAVSIAFLRLLDIQRADRAQRQLIDDLEEELQTARQLQMSLMPTASPDIPGFDIAGRCETVNHVGGDFFQYFERDGHLAIGLADVTGHAMEAAVPVMVFSGVLKTEMRHRQPLDQLFANLNTTMHDALLDRTFVCFTMGEVDLRQNTVHLANSGCPYPFHYRAETGEIVELQVDAYPLGVRPQADFHTLDQPLSPGDYLIFCSDGLIEAANPSEAIFGFDQTAATLRQGCADGLSSEALIDHLVTAVQTFSGDEPQGDDMTCVVLRVID